MRFVFSFCPRRIGGKVAPRSSRIFLIIAVERMRRFACLLRSDKSECDASSHCAMMPRTGNTRIRQSLNASYHISKVYDYIGRAGVYYSPRDSFSSLRRFSGFGTQHLPPSMCAHKSCIAFYLNTTFATATRWRCMQRRNAHSRGAKAVSRCRRWCVCRGIHNESRTNKIATHGSAYIESNEFIQCRLRDPKVTELLKWEFLIKRKP